MTDVLAISLLLTRGSKQREENIFKLNMQIRTKNTKFHEFLKLKHGMLKSHTYFILRTKGSLVLCCQLLSSAKVLKALVHKSLKSIHLF